MENFGNRKVFADNLKYYLESRGKTRADVCYDLDIPYTSFVNWETARSYPRIDTVEKIARYFGVPKSSLTERRTDERKGFSVKQRLVIEMIEQLPPDKLEAVLPLIEQAILLAQK